MRTRTLDRVKREVHAPLRQFFPDKSALELSVAPIVNAISKYKSGSILNSPANKAVTYSDIAGEEVKMITNVGGYYYMDDAKIIGQRGNYYIVEVEGSLWSVAKGITAFVRYNK